MTGRDERGPAGRAAGGHPEASSGAGSPSPEPPGRTSGRSGKPRRELRSRFRAVATVGVACAVVLGGVVLGLTGSVALGVAVAVLVAVLLVGLGVVGVRQGEAQPAALAAHEARQQRLRTALADEQRRASERRD